MSASKRSLKKVIEKVVHGPLRCVIPAGMAGAGPPLGTQLGQRGLNIPTFCKDFNNRTANYIEGVPLPVRAVVNPDRSYKMTIHQPPVTFLVKQAAGIQRGAMRPSQEVAGWITLKHVYEIALIKSQDPPNELTTMENMCKAIIGTAHSCGIKVVRDYDPEEYGTFLKEREVLVQEQLTELREQKEAKLLRK